MPRWSTLLSSSYNEHLIFMQKFRNILDSYTDLTFTIGYVISIRICPIKYIIDCS